MWGSLSAIGSMQRRMKNRKSRGRSEQPSLQSLLQSAQRSEKHEDDLDKLTAAAAQALFELSGCSGQYDGQRSSTAQSTKSEELPVKETGEEVVVRPANPSLQDQDGEERVTFIANSSDSLEVNGDVGTEKQGQGSEDLTGLAIGELRGASILHPLLIEESESDSELPTTIHPSSAPEGSLLHALHLQLLGAGSDGITVRELFKCLKKPAEVLGFGSDWKVQVRRHLKTNPHFCDAKGYHYLVRNDQLQVQQPPNKRSPANIASTSRRYGASSSEAVLSSQQSTPATVQTGLSVDTLKGVGRRKAFLKAKAALSEQATELEEMHQNTGDMRIIPSSVADPTDSQLVSHGPLLPSNRKRKSSSSHDEELPDHGLPIPGGLQATQAEILAKAEVQTDQRCVVLKDDDTGSWRCNDMAMAGHTLCDHHRRLHRQEDGKTSLSPTPGSPSIAPEADFQTRVLCGHSYKSEDGSGSLQCSRIAMTGHRLCEDHKQLCEDHHQLREERKVPQLADAQQGKQGATTNLQHNQDSGILGLPESHPNLDQSSLSLHPKSAAISPPISREAAKNVDKLVTGVSNHDDDSDGEQWQQQMPKNVPKRRYVAARKTAANVGPLKSQGLVRTPTVPPLPPPCGSRRKAPVKKRDH